MKLRTMLALALVGVYSLYGASTRSSCFDGETVTDVYTIKLKVCVPRIYDNTCSLGYRKYQWQTIQGDMYITYDANESSDDYERPKIEIKNLVNKTHKINGANITYDCTINNSGECDGPYTRVNVIGDNKKDVFKTASIVFYMDAEPSYNVGEDDEDNSLLITLGGKGSVSTYKWYPYYACSVCSSKYSSCYLKVPIISSMSGNLSGTLGCGCRAYGHKSPTRVMGYLGPTDIVDDVGSVFGSWTAKFKGRL